jgi:phage replication initiation protein
MPEQGLGRTLYVGNRKNGKICRIYEKGRQLGNCKSPWTRLECEILSRDRVIPSDVLTSPETYLAAQYPITQTLLKQIGQRIKTIKNEVSATLEKSVKHAIVQCGALINYLGAALDFSDTQIVTLLKKEGHSPARLSKYAHSQVQNLAQFRVDILRGFSAQGV